MFWIHIFQSVFRFLEFRFSESQFFWLKFFQFLFFKFQYLIGIFWIWIIEFRLFGIWIFQSTFDFFNVFFSWSVIFKRKVLRRLDFHLEFHNSFSSSKQAVFRVRANTLRNRICRSRWDMIRGLSYQEAPRYKIIKVPARLTKSNSDSA